jgi:hypothetical protein
LLAAPVSFVVSLVAFIKGGRRGHSLAGMALSTSPAWLLVFPDAFWKAFCH